jgi:hypothetical protein
VPEADEGMSAEIRDEKGDVGGPDGDGELVSDRVGGVHRRRVLDGREHVGEVHARDERLPRRTIIRTSPERSRVMRRVAPQAIRMIPARGVIARPVGRSQTALHEGVCRSTIHGLA